MNTIFTSKYRIPQIVSVIKRLKNRKSQHIKAPNVPKAREKWVSNPVKSAEVALPDLSSDCKPIDKAWLCDQYPTIMYSPLNAIQMHLEMVEMLNLRESMLMTRFVLNMETDKKTKFLNNVKGIFGFPHIFEDGPTKNVIVICKRPQHLEIARRLGCYMYGYEDVIKKFQGNEILEFTYDYLLCTPDVYADVLKLRKKITPERFPTQKNGRLVTDLNEAIILHKMGSVYESGKTDNATGILRINIGPVSMSAEQLTENFTAFLTHINAKHSPPSGHFIKSAVIMCPPSTEEFFIDTDPLLQDEDEEIVTTAEESQ